MLMMMCESAALVVAYVDDVVIATNQGSSTYSLTPIIEDGVSLPNWILPSPIVVVLSFLDRHQPTMGFGMAHQ